MPVVLTEDAYPEVRAALDVNLEEDRLPDSVIQMGPYQGMAEREAIARIPGWATLDEPFAENFRVAVILKTAARIAPAMPSITREDRLAFSYTRQGVDWVARAAQLNQQADVLFDTINPTPSPTTDTIRAQVIFSKASSRRGGF
jgi:hypothetical protein